MIVVVDYGVGNIGSILNMLKKLGIDAAAAANERMLTGAHAIILPGVGAFDTGARRLEQSGLRHVLEERVIRQQVPCLGLCLGMQLLARESEEGRLPGLGWIDAAVVRFRSANTHELRVPHMGWNTIQPLRKHPLLVGLESTARFYFVHSYHLAGVADSVALAQTEYGAPFVSAVAANNVLGVQWHPEKSHRYGMMLLKNFADWAAQRAGLPQASSEIRSA